MYNAQRRIAERNLLQNHVTIKTSYVIGLDAAYSKRYGGVGVAVLASVQEKRVIDIGISVGEPAIPYIPGLLAFREAPLLYTAFFDISTREGFLPEETIIIVDGHGISHPRRAGIATHIGVALRIPSIGVAKKRLYGKEVCSAGNCYLVDENNEKIAAIITSRRRRLYVSPGYAVPLIEAVKIIASLLTSSQFLPFPLYLADKFSKKIARGLDGGAYTPSQLKSRGLGAWF